MGVICGLPTLARAFAALLLREPHAAGIEAAILVGDQAESDGRDDKPGNQQQEREARKAQPPPIDMTRPHGRFDAFA